MKISGRRRLMLAGLLLAPSAWAQQLGRMGERALREMQIHRVEELGLTIWTENQPAWETDLQQIKGRSSFVAQSPDRYHPPAVLIYSSWPQERVADEHFETMARAALQTAGRNFGLNVAQAGSVRIQAARYGVLEGWESGFAGRAQGDAVDVKLFVGRKPGRFPVVLTAYTLQGKMQHLAEVLRRAWGNVDYLD